MGHFLNVMAGYSSLRSWTIGCYYRVLRNAKYYRWCNEREGKGITGGYIAIPSVPLAMGLGLSCFISGWSAVGFLGLFDMESLDFLDLLDMGIRGKVVV